MKQGEEEGEPKRYRGPQGQTVRDTKKSVYTNRLEYFLVWSDTDQTHRIPMEGAQGERVGPFSSFGEHGQTVRDTI